MDNHAFRAVNEVARRFPRTIPRLNRFASNVASQRERVGWSHAIFASPRLVRFEEMEYAVPREHAVEALRAAKAVLERHPVSFPIELRFVAADDTFLSPASRPRRRLRRRARVQGDGVRGAVPRGRGRRWRAFDGRPAWGKRSYLSAAELAPRYPRWDDFQAIRAQLDPDGRFANAWARHVLG